MSFKSFFVSLKRTTFWLIPTILLFVIKASRNFEDSLKFLEKYPWKTLENSRVFKGTLEKPLKCFGYPWKFEGFQGYPWPWLTLEIQLQGRGTLNFKATIALTRSKPVPRDATGSAKHLTTNKDISVQWTTESGVVKYSLNFFLCISKDF